jgi:hypothetical protein
MAGALIGLIGQICVVTSAGAQEVTAAPDAQHVEAAKELVAAMDAKGQAMTSLEQLRQALIMRIQASDPKKVVGFTAYTEKEMDPNGARVRDFLTDMENIAVQFYARTFSVEEMKAIATFQKSDAGRKFNQKTPELGGLIAARMGRFQTELIKAVEQGAAGQAK